MYKILSQPPHKIFGRRSLLSSSNQPFTPEVLIFPNAPKAVSRIGVDFDVVLNTELSSRGMEITILKQSGIFS